MNARRAVIFDVDGVLVDSPHERAWRETLEQLMAGPWRALAEQSRWRPGAFTTAVYQAAVAGKPRLDGARAALEHFGVPDAAHHVEEYAEHKQARLVELIRAGEFRAFPDALRFVRALRALAVPIAIASSSKNAPELLRAIEIEPGVSLLDACDVDLSGRTLAHGKPHPDIFLAAAHELGIEPARCVVVEDAPSGVLAAKAGGMTALGVARLDDADLLSAAGADRVVSTLDAVDARALVEGRLAAAA